MPTTIEGGPWEYLPVLNECIKILLTVLIGVLAGRFNALDAKVFVPQAVKFVFQIALPVHICRGIGIVTDFYDDSFLWSYISAFLILRVIALAVSIGMVVWRLGSRNVGIGQVAVNWLALSWISTVILGIPIAKAVFGDESIGQTYGFLAGISSFIFQLPFQLLLLECHVQERDYNNITHAHSNNNNNNNTAPSPSLDHVGEGGDMSGDSATKELPEQATMRNNDDSLAANQVSTDATEEQDLNSWTRFVCNCDVWYRIGKKAIWNPVLVGIAVGFCLSLSTLGPKYLKPSSPQFVPGLFFVWDTMGWLGDCVSPVSLVTMGVWMEQQGRCQSLFGQMTFPAALLYMCSKLVVLPVIMVGLAQAFDLNDTAGRAAILIAALPISMASFTLASQYEIGQNVLSANVALGTLLLLPTMLLWNWALDDAVGLYPIDKNSV